MCLNFLEKMIKKKGRTPPKKKEISNLTIKINEFVIEDNQEFRKKIEKNLNIISKKNDSIQL